MTKLLIRLAINAIALYAAVAVLNGHGITAQSQNWLSILFLAIIFGVINALLRPLLMVLSCPLIILTLGLGTILVNTALFYLTGVIGSQFGIGFTVDGFWPALLGAIIVSIVSFILSIFLKEDHRNHKKQH
jgi:putative membrane protein